MARDRPILRGRGPEEAVKVSKTFAGQSLQGPAGRLAMMTAQVTPDGEKFGMNVSGIDNRQFALNTMRWLAGNSD